ncbi:hypothetical protein KL905_003168 [Ogataea polymorpha]|uniref:Uncharacterized protein n=1 Tax=Ogataea polymorpha TaxID=460523 RepID=A0A9P8TGK0_9ASCO|nr:hypothetical protein KL937_003196 [Ogataea polymorpha]KAG7892497.1 hypothetical protein KL908_003449 [Ogataea polymorpha]KAG7900344.1 hypothetical protein KL935_003087 [Ogataea polymorpha]KAG7909273.1 hypothetical protein KL906_002767 [Ogataea polymorpha]KAG7915993.1 hypothetical protein KL927_003458 [Ogataea polymorpha]
MSSARLSRFWVWRGPKAFYRFSSFQSKTSAVSEPLGYPYFCKKFRSEIDLFKKYCASDSNGNLDLFRNLHRYNKNVPNKERLSLFVTTLKRNKQFYDYLMQQLNPSKTSDDPVSPPAESGQPETIGSLLTKVKEVPKAEPEQRPVAVKKKKNNASFKDLLSSINKIQKKDSYHHHELPRMTNFTPMPSYRPFIMSVDQGPSEAPTELESFLQEAKHQNDMTQEQLFKSVQNYEWARQQTSKDQRSFEAGNFFTPVLVPNTFVPSSLFAGQNNSNIELFPSLTSEKQMPKGYEFMILHENGKTEKVREYDPHDLEPHKPNVSRLLSQLRSPEAYVRHINKLIAQNWHLLEGDLDKLVFFRKKSTKFYLWVRNSLAVVGLGFLGILGLSYFVDSDEITQLADFKDARKNKDITMT